MAWDGVWWRWGAVGKGKGRVRWAGVGWVEWGGVG